MIQEQINWIKAKTNASAQSKKKYTEKELETLNFYSYPDKDKVIKEALGKYINKHGI